MDITIISIGALSKNPLWGERTPVRPSHATTTLIQTADIRILIDPSLPDQALAARLDERSGLKPDAITHVFLTNWRPIHRRGLGLFPKATWWIHSLEKDAAERALDTAREQLERGTKDLAPLIRSEEELLKRVEAAPDTLAPGVDLFPLPGYTEGQSGLLVSEPTRTTIVAGDAVPTAAHFLNAQVFPDSFDLARAKESLAEMYEVADIIIPGHDNLFLVPRAV